LTTDAALAAKVHALVGANDAIKIAFDAPLHEETPQRFRELLTVSETPTQTSAVITPFPRKERGKILNDWRLPMAAGIALVIGAMGGGMGANLMSPSTPTLLARIEPALSTTPSAQTVAIGADGELKPILTFATSDGRYCREFEWTQSREQFVGVACNVGGDWQLEAMLAAQTDTANANAYRQANGHAGAAIDAVLTALQAGEPMSAEAEAEAIKRGFVNAPR
jgi:hypothetical protein